MKKLNKPLDCWFIELAGYDMGIPVYKVQSSYYLATYRTIFGLVHICSSHDSITSCVVRHVKNEDFFFNYELALNACDRKNKQSRQQNL